MLDRGAELDWFNSTEVMLELGVAIAARLDVHRPHGDQPRSRSSTSGLFMDRNFSAALVLIFVVGIVLLATMALLPPMLQNLFGYPIITVGLVLAPRGLGTMASMMVVGRLVGKIDPRLLVLFGLSLTALLALPDDVLLRRHGRLAADHLRRHPGLRPRLRLHPALDRRVPDARPAAAHGSIGLFNLVRNLGSSIGISIMAALLISNMQTNHATLAEHINPFNPNLPALGIDPACSQRRPARRPRRSSTA